jgi:hypothetical protein
MQPARARRLALALWTIWAVIVWNVVFDHVIVVAGREYLFAAVHAARSGAGYLGMDEWMRPAVSRGLWIASASAAAILVTGLIAVAFASRMPEPFFSEK